MSSSDGAAEKQLVNEKANKATEELTNGMLLDQLDVLEEQKTKLLLNLKECKEKYEQQKADQTDIYYYLNKKLDENYETIALLEEQILNEQTQRELHEKKLEKRIEDLNLKISSDEVRHQNKLKEAEEKLQKLKDFSDNKEELENNFEKLLRTLEAERKHYSDLVDENERKSIRERDRFRKDCVVQFEEYKQKLQDEADDKLSSKTKKTLKTNKMITTELNYQSKQADLVLVYNKKVLDKDRELRQELELTQTTQKEMVKRLALYQRLIKQLNEKVNSQETSIQELMDSTSRDLKEKDEVIDNLEQQLEKLRHKQSSGRKSNNQEDALFVFLSAKFREMTGGGGVHGADTSKAYVKKHGESILSELLVHALQHHPDRFAQVLQDGGRAVHSGRAMFPPLNSGASTSDDDCFGGGLQSRLQQQLLTGISAWDTARSSSKQNWWSALSNSEADGGEPFSQGVQTEGRVPHYPAASKWLDGSASVSSGGASAAKAGIRRPEGCFVNHEGRRMKSGSAQAGEGESEGEGDATSRLEIDVISLTGGGVVGRHASSRDDTMFSPMGGDPLRRSGNNMNKKTRGNSHSVSSSKSAQSRK